MTNSILSTGYAAFAEAQRQADASYTEDINNCLTRWSSFLDLSTRSVGIFTLTMMTYIDDLLARFFDRANFPEHAALAVRENKKMLRDIQAKAADLRRNCAPQCDTEWWPVSAVREAIERYQQQGFAHDYTILHYTLTNYLYKQKLDLPGPLYDLYLCTCLVRLIDINVDCYSRSLIDIDPLFADILNVPSPSEDTSDEGKHIPLHLLPGGDTKLHSRLRHTNPQLHRELSHRRFARTRPLREALSAAVNKLYGHCSLTLPDSGRLMSDNTLSLVGQAAVIMLNRANRTDFIRRATEPRMWAEFDAIEQDYKDWLADHERDHDIAAAHEWKMQSEKCGEHVAAVGAVRKWKEGDHKDAAAWLDLCTELEEQWTEYEAEARRSFDAERDATAKLHPDWTPEKVERAVSQIQYGIHEAALTYDVEALKYHLEQMRPKGVTKKALQHERVQRRKKKP